MAALVYIGKGCEDLEKTWKTWRGSPTLRYTLKVFISAFLKWLAHTEYRKHVNLRGGFVEGKKALAVYTRLGLGWAHRASCSADYGVQSEKCHSAQTPRATRARGGSVCGGPVACLWRVVLVGLWRQCGGLWRVVAGSGRLQQGLPRGL